jgi:hypothetical protein
VGIVRTRRLSVSCLVVALAACGQDGPPPPPPATNAPVTAVPQPVGVAVPQPVGVGVPQPVGVPAAGGSNFGTISLAPGFMPDPHTARGTSGGAIDASTLNATCRGWISQQPDHLFVAQGAFANLRLMVNGASQDTTLVVQRADGSYVCDDDTEGRDPVVAGGFAPGIYKIWVGSYSRGQSIPYTLGVSELASSMPSTLGGGGAGAVAAGAGAAALDTTGGEANFGTVSLQPGFTPDPSIHSGTSGGAVAANGVSPACAGYVSARPDHLFNAAGSFTNLRILVNSSADTTLVVRRPDGTFMCNDDSDGTNPAVAGVFPPGQYRIWVGSYQQGQNAPYKLGFTELASVTSAQLGL